MGVMIVMLLFAATSTITLLVNWWLGRWANAESTRYGVKRVTRDNCTPYDQASVGNLTMTEWQQKRDNYFYVFLGKYFQLEFMIHENLHNRIGLANYSHTVYTHDVLLRHEPHCRTDTSQSDVQLHTSSTRLILRFEPNW